MWREPGLGLVDARRGALVVGVLLFSQFGKQRIQRAIEHLAQLTIGDLMRQQRLRLGELVPALPVDGECRAERFSRQRLGLRYWLATLSLLCRLGHLRRRRRRNDHRQHIGDGIASADHLFNLPFALACCSLQQARGDCPPTDEPRAHQARTDEGRPWRLFSKMIGQRRASRAAVIRCLAAPSDSFNRSTEY